VVFGRPGRSRKEILCPGDEGGSPRQPDPWLRTCAAAVPHPGGYRHVDSVANALLPDWI
jgi:hypothetical protein